MSLKLRHTAAPRGCLPRLGGPSCLSTRVLAIGLFLGISLPTFVSAQTIISGPIFDGSGGPLVPAGSPYVVPAASFITRSPPDRP